MNDSQDGLPDYAASGKTMIRVPFRGRGFAPISLPFVSWAALIVVVALWQLSSAMAWVSPTFLPGPVAVALALRDMAVSGELWKDLSASLLRIGFGWTIGTIVGLVVGVLMGLSSVARSIAAPGISALFPIPKIALLPLIILWLGIGETSKIVTIAAGVFFPTAIATYSSIDSVPRNIIRMSQVFGVPTMTIVFKTLLPGSLPGILSGMRISIATALLLVVAAEMIGAENGIGAFVMLAGNLMRSDQLLAGVAVISVLGLSIGLLLSALEKSLFRWR